MFRPMLCSRKRFLSTPSARRATTGSLAKQQRTGISIHALREEGDINFQLPRIPRSISIHALREEGDKTFSVFEMLLSHFYPRPPRGGRLRMPAFLFAVTAFLSTPSARRATSYAGLSFCSNGISIHALREEGDRLSQPRFPVAFISIHALREEGDLVLQLLNQT